MLFEAPALQLHGPVNGHNIEEVERHSRMAAHDDQPVLAASCSPARGRGACPRLSLSKFPRLGKFESPQARRAAQTAGAPPTYTDIFWRNALPARQRGRPHRSRDRRHVHGHGNGHIKSRFPTCHGRRICGTARCHYGGPRLARLPSLCGDSPPFPRAYDQIIKYTMGAFKTS